MAASNRARAVLYAFVDLPARDISALRGRLPNAAYPAQLAASVRSVLAHNAGDEVLVVTFGARAHAAVRRAVPITLSLTHTFEETRNFPRLL